MRRAIAFLTFVWVCGAVQASGQAITPSIETNVTSGPSPLAVRFSAIGTRHSNSSINTNRFHELLYLWDYDDPTSGTWAPTGKSRNQMSGPLGAHVFEPSSFPDCSGRCKVYRVQLTVRDAVAESASTVKLVTVYDPNDPTNGWGAAGKSVCVSKVGNFSGCPGSARREANSGSFDSILRSQIAAGVRRILFRAGESWRMSGNYSLSADGPGMVGSYGGGKFTIEFASGIRPFFLSGDDWRIQDANLTVAGTIGAPFEAYSQVRNLLVQRTTSEPNSFQSMATFPAQGLPIGPAEMIHRHLFFVDNVWPDLTNPGGGYHLYVAAWGLSILGNDFGASSSEHTVRVETAEELLISNNEMGPGAYGKSTLNLRDLPSQCRECGAYPYKPFCGRQTRYYLIQDNNFLCNWPSCIGTGLQTCGFDPFYSLAEVDYLFERNYFEKGPSDQAGANVINAEAPHGEKVRWVYRNNIADVTSWKWGAGFVGQRGVKIYNNTCYRSDSVTEGSAQCVNPNGADECRNNVMYAPNWTRTFSWKSATSSCVAASNNFDNGLTRNITRNPFVSDRPSRWLDFAPGSGSELIDSGRAVSGLFDDHVLHCRTGTTDGGAVERGATTTCADGAGSTEPLGQPGKPTLYP